MYVRYKQVQALISASESGLQLLNYTSLLMGIASTVGMCVVANFQVTPTVSFSGLSVYINSLKLFIYSSRKQIWHPSTSSEQAWPLVLGRCISWSRLACRTACSRVSTAGIFCGRVWLWECGRSLASLHVSFFSIYAQLPQCVMNLFIPIVQLCQYLIPVLLLWLNVSVFISSVLMYDDLPGVDLANKLHWQPGERVRQMIRLIWTYCTMSFNI